ncbi:helix-turn-helix transcriptional regulator [Granulicoccus phenolivorans]|uniref:helix-turn-helix transcriptional regulator n=1 Tax=Granulicoccus phenolivorans TaxID=266854 RepID=UPI00041CEAF6|nr:helix-turn-helix domain-containing protein [Granulicoccus phenolivorans]
MKRTQESTRPQPVDPAVVDPTEEGGTRQRVVDSILHHGPSTTAELAERLDLTQAAIRRHLAGLTESGRVAAREQRVYGSRGRGRPAKVYALTDTGRESLPQAYDELAVQALSYLAKAAGDSAVDTFAAERAQRVEPHFRRLRAEAPERDTAEVLAEALRRSGYVASTQPVRSGTQLCFNQCPVAHVAERFPQLCEAEAKVFSELLDAHVQQLATIAHGDGVCTTFIPNIPVRYPEQSTDREGA